MEYRFLEKEHFHQLKMGDGTWKNLTGTSTITKVISKPLTWWASGMAVGVFGWLDPKKNDSESVKQEAWKGFLKVKDLDFDGYVSLLGQAYRAHDTSLDKSKTKGKDLHLELKRFVKSQMGKTKETDFAPEIQPFIDWSKENVKRFIASEVHTYSQKLWVGGIVDCVAELKDGTFAVIDFKSHREGYPSDFLQCGGYQLELEESGMFSADGKHHKKLEKPISSIIVVPFGGKPIIPAIRKNTDEWKQGFEWATGLYRLLEFEK